MYTWALVMALGRTKQKETRVPFITSKPRHRFTYDRSCVTFRGCRRGLLMLLEK